MDSEFEKLYLENQLCFPLYAASRLTTKLYEPFLKAIDITYPQYLVLLVLWKDGSKSVTEIGEQLFLESNTLTPLLKRMEEKGLIQRKRSENDERKVVVALSTKGKELKNEAVLIPEKMIASFAGENANSDQLIAFRTQLQNVVKLLSAKLNQ